MTPLGSVSVKTAVVASPGPLLVMLIVYRTVSPTFGAGSSTVLETSRSASLMTAVCSSAPLFAVLGSGVVAVTPARLVTDVPCGTEGSTVAVITTVAPAA